MSDISDKPWTGTRKILFRLVFTYVLLYCFAFPIYFFPYGHTLIHPIGSQLQDLAIWIGYYVFGIMEEIPASETGSGGTLIYWLLWATKSMLAILVTLVWSALDRRRPSYVFLNNFLITFVRYYVALILFSYGMAKVISTQFIEPSYTQLMKTYGESSPMNLLWTLMGFSTPYQIFGGIMEVLAAVFLLFRRTVLLGALVMITVMTNVVAMNYAFDVPVKLASTHYLIFSIGLAMLFKKNLIALFFLRKTSEPVILPPLFKQRKTFIGSQVFKAVFLLYFGFTTVSGNLDYFNSIKERGFSAPLAGIYEVKQIYIDSDSSTMISSKLPMKMMIFDNQRPERLTIIFGDDKKVRYSASFDQENQALSALLPSDSTNSLDMLYHVEKMESFC